MLDTLKSLTGQWSGAPIWKKVLLAIGIVLVAVLVAVTFWLYLRPKDDDDSPAFKVAEDRGEVIDGIVARNEERDRELAADGEKLRTEREDIEKEIAESGEGREAFHEEVDRAAARGDIAGIDAARDRRRQR